MSAQTQPRSPFEAVYQQLLDNGYSVLPIAPDSKAPSEFRAGRWYPMKKWDQFRHEPARPFIAKMWAGWHGCNIGILTGTKVTATHMVACVDFDTDDPDILSDLESALPPSPVRKKGRRGYSAFYLVPVGTKGFRTAIVELLTDTRQTVIPPSIHPDTGLPYGWMGEKTLLNTPAHELPVLTEDDLERFAEQVEALTKKPVRSAEPQALIQLPDDDQKYWRVLNNTAFSNLDRWVPDLDLPKCERTSTGIYKAVAHWRPSTSGRPLSQRSPNLSIMPNAGARDFGTGDRFTAINLVMHALDLSLDDAVGFLSSRLGLSADMTFNFAPLEIEAEPTPINSEIKWVQAAPTGEEQVENVVDPATGEIIEEVVREVVVPSGKHDFDEIPDALLYPQGLLGEIMDWIVAGARRPSRVLALGPALTIIGTIAGQVVSGPTRSGTHLDAIGLAPSGAGKDHPLQAIKRILSASNQKDLIGPSEFISMPSVINFLQRQSLSVCPMDEIGAWLKRLNNRNASQFEASISKILRTIWGTSFDTYMTPEWAQRASVEIHNPALSLYGVSTMEEFFEGLEGADIRNGFLNRFLVFATNRKSLDREPLHDGEVPEALALAVAALRNKLWQISEADLAAPFNATRSVKRMVWNGGRSTWDGMVKELEKISEDRDREPYFARTAEIAIRLASIHALGCGRMEIEREDMEWGRGLAMWSASNMARVTANYMAENENQKVYNRVIRMIEAAPNKTLHRRILLQKLRGAVKARDLEEMLKSAIEGGEIEEIKKIPAQGGKPSVVYKMMR
jgi:hypothetical protein